MDCPGLDCPDSRFDSGTVDEREVTKSVRRASLTQKNSLSRTKFADGIDRVLAAEMIGLTEIAAEVMLGTQRDAVLYSCGAARDSRTAAN